MIDKVKVTFFIPDKLQKEMREKIGSDGYSLREKSEWVSQAITRLLEANNYIDLVVLGDMLNGFEKVESILLDRDVKKKLSEAIISIRQEHPSIEGVQSRIIRTSIVQRILRT